MSSIELASLSCTPKEAFWNSTEVLVLGAGKVESKAAAEDRSRRGINSRITGSVIGGG